MIRHALAISLLLGLAACSTLVSPGAIRDCSSLPESERAEHLARWQAAVELANGFLASEENESMPAGEYLLSDEGMTFRTPEREYEVTIRNTWWGDLTVCTGYTAQERSWGFVVGTEGDGPEVVANSFFRSPDDEPREPARMARLILHETAHQVHGVGTLSLGKSLHYYWYAIFHPNTRHPDEELPRRVSKEFVYWSDPELRELRDQVRAAESQ